MGNMKRTAFAAMCMAAVCACAQHGGWAPKFYPGLEAVGSVEWVPGGFKGKVEAVRLKWESGAMKFGVAKTVKTDLTGFVDWTVSAQVKSEGNYGYAGVALEFFDGSGKSLEDVFFEVTEGHVTVSGFSSIVTTK